MVMQPGRDTGLELSAGIAELGELDEVLELEVVDVVDQSRSERRSRRALLGVRLPGLRGVLARRFEPGRQQDAGHQQGDHGQPAGHPEGQQGDGPDEDCHHSHQHRVSRGRREHSAFGDSEGQQEQAEAHRNQGEEGDHA